MSQIQTPAPPAPEFDPSAVEAAAEHLGGAFVGTAVTLMIDLGYRTGLFEAAAAGPATSAELAERSGLSERHVREWLGAVTTAGIVDVDAESAVYTMRPEYAVLLTGDTAMNQAAVAPMLVHLAHHIDSVAHTFEHGGGVPYAEYRPHFTGVMDDVGRRKYDALLLDAYLPLVDGLVERLDRGTSVIDIGCGTGHCINLMAKRFPNSQFTGFDIAEDAIVLATDEAARQGLGNARFEVRDVIDLPTDTPFGVVTAFDAIHDQAAPAEVLLAAHDALEPDGIFFMVDIKSSSDVATDVSNPLAPMVYAVSVLHCMQVSLAAGGAGLGTAWGERVACEMLRDAGFEQLEVHEMENDAFNLAYGARKPAARS